jgi:hypothetical protein
METLKLLVRGFYRLAYVEAQKPKRWPLRPSVHPSWRYDATVIGLCAFLAVIYFTG